MLCKWTELIYVFNKSLNKPSQLQEPREILRSSFFLNLIQIWFDLTRLSIWMSRINKMVKIWPEIASFNDLKASAIQPHWILGNILNRVTSSFPRILNYFQISKANTHSVQFTPIFPPPHFTTLTHPHAHPRTHAHSHTRTPPSCWEEKTVQKYPSFNPAPKQPLCPQTFFSHDSCFWSCQKLWKIFNSRENPAWTPKKLNWACWSKRHFWAKVFYERTLTSASHIFTAH